MYILINLSKPHKDQIAFDYCKNLTSKANLRTISFNIFCRHLFAVGSSAYSQVTAANNSSANQVVVISGESGSGKTESTKLVMQYLAAVNRAPNNLVTEQILEATPLLESFGNAKTPRNDNSSRFGKYLEVHFRE